MNQYKLSFGSYHTSYYLGSNCINEAINLLSKIDCDKFLIISDRDISSSYGNLLKSKIDEFSECHLLEFDSGETNKNINTLSVLFEQALSLNISRSSYILGLGGGIAGNIAGLIAALAYRGIRWSFIPTSLMAMLDSSLSIKQAVNFSKAKNVFGTYYSPEMIITDIDYLKTLSKTHIRSGMCEVVKNALIVDSSYLERVFQTLNPDSVYTEDDYRFVIQASIKSKMQVMKNDPKESGEALVLEYGHTIGHAMELAAKGNISHGDAIALGMVCAAEIALMLGYLSKEIVDLHKEILIKAGVRLSNSHNLKIDEIATRVAFDNKRGYLPAKEDHVYMVLLEDIEKPLRTGKSLLFPVPTQLVHKSMRKLFVNR